MNVLKRIPMKCLSNFQNRAVGTPSTLLGKYVNRVSNPLESEKNSIQDILNLVNLNKPTVSDAFEEAENINSKCDPLQFNENDLIVFQGSDSYKFNVIELTKSFRTEEATHRTKIKVNILAMIESTENFLTFEGDATWEKAR